MSPPAHSLVESTRIVMHNAEAMHDRMLFGDVVMAHSYAVLLDSQVQELVHELTVALRSATEPELHGRTNPYRAVTLPPGSVVDGLATLSDEELLEYCRETYWERENRALPLDRWWLSKRMAILKHELSSRGIDEQAWRDSGESL